MPAPFPFQLDRPLLGFPDTHAHLKVESESEVVVEIASPTGVTIWNPENYELAISMYHHPFAHGYEWEPPIETEV